MGGTAEEMAGLGGQSSVLEEGTPWSYVGVPRGLHHPTLPAPTPASPYLQFQPGGGLCAHPIGIGASQALGTEGAIGRWPLADEVQ